MTNKILCIHNCFRTKDHDISEIVCELTKAKAKYTISVIYENLMVVMAKCFIYVFNVVIKLLLISILNLYVQVFAEFNIGGTTIYTTFLVSLIVQINCTNIWGLGFWYIFWQHYDYIIYSLQQNHFTNQNLNQLYYIARAGKWWENQRVWQIRRQRRRSRVRYFFTLITKKTINSRNGTCAVLRLQPAVLRFPLAAAALP